jgi:hypothetical protein
MEEEAGAGHRPGVYPGGTSSSNGADEQWRATTEVLWDGKVCCSNHFRWREKKEASIVVLGVVCVLVYVVVALMTRGFV